MRSGWTRRFPLVGPIIGRSGGLGAHREVDPWAHFVNVYMLDKDGNRIDRRNPQDIFTPLYNHQLPPGAGQVVHYAFTVPENQRGPLEVKVALRYRKFDTIYVNYFDGTDYARGAPLTVTNELPIVTIASDQISFPVTGVGVGAGLAEPDPSFAKALVGKLGAATPAIASPQAPAERPAAIPAWQRWNDYGIGLLLEGDRGSSKGELIQAADAFAHVEQLGRPDGPVNLARVYYKEGRLDDAISALQRAARSIRQPRAGHSPG